MIFSEIEKEIHFTAIRSRGPGGQNVNKVSSAAQLYWDYKLSQGLNDAEKSLVEKKMSALINKEGQVYMRSDEFRDLERNKSRCLEKLQEYLKAAFFKPKPRRATKPTFSSKVKKRESKTRRGDVKKARQRVRV